MRGGLVVRFWWPRMDGGGADASGPACSCRGLLSTQSCGALYNSPTFLREGLSLIKNNQVPSSAELGWVLEERTLLSPGKNNSWMSWYCEDTGKKGFIVEESVVVRLS